MKCLNCGKTIKRIIPFPYANGNAWGHIESSSLWCGNGMLDKSGHSMRATPLIREMELKSQTVNRE